MTASALSLVQDHDPFCEVEVTGRFSVAACVWVAYLSDVVPGGPAGRSWPDGESLEGIARKMNEDEEIVVELGDDYTVHKKWLFRQPQQVSSLLSMFSAIQQLGSNPIVNSSACHSR